MYRNSSTETRDQQARSAYAPNHRRLKRKFKEVEQDNFQVGVRLLAAQQRIAKLRAERSVLLEMLSQFNPEEIDASDVSGTDDDASDSQARPWCAAGCSRLHLSSCAAAAHPDASRLNTCLHSAHTVTPACIAPILCGFPHSITCVLTCPHAHPQSRNRQASVGERPRRGVKKASKARQ